MAEMSVRDEGLLVPMGRSHPPRPLPHNRVVSAFAHLRRSPFAESFEQLLEPYRSSLRSDIETMDRQLWSFHSLKVLLAKHQKVDLRIRIARLPMLGRQFVRRATC